MYVPLCRWDPLCGIFMLYISCEYLCRIFVMKIFAQYIYIYIYHIDNNTWQRYRKYFMLMWKGARGQQKYMKYLGVLGSIYEMIYMLMLACQRVYYADMEMCQWPKYLPLHT